MAMFRSKKKDEPEHLNIAINEVFGEEEDMQEQDVVWDPKLLHELAMESNALAGIDDGVDKTHFENSPLMINEALSGEMARNGSQNSSFCGQADSEGASIGFSSEMDSLGKKKIKSTFKYILADGLLGIPLLLIGYVGLALLVVMLHVVFVLLILLIAGLLFGGVAVIVIAFSKLHEQLLLMFFAFSIGLTCASVGVLTIWPCAGLKGVLIPSSKKLFKRFYCKLHLFREKEVISEEKKGVGNEEN